LELESVLHELSRPNTGYDSYTKKIMIGPTEFILRHTYFRDEVPRSVDFAFVNVDGAELPSLTVRGNLNVVKKTMRFEGEGEEESGDLNVDGTIYTNGKEVALKNHEHSWTKVTPTAGSGVKINSSYCAYNSALGLGIVRLSISITPTSDIDSGDIITLATLSGDIVPNYICALANHVGSANARRWSTGINTEGKINARANTALVKGSTYPLYICGTFPL